MLVLLVASVFSLVDTDAAILPDVDQGSVWVDHRVPDLLNPSAVPGSKWCVQGLLLSVAVRVPEEFPPCGPDLWGGAGLSWVVKDGVAGWVKSGDRPVAECPSVAVTNVGKGDNPEEEAASLRMDEVDGADVRK